MAHGPCLRNLTLKEEQSSLRKLAMSVRPGKLSAFNECY